MNKKKSQHSQCEDFVPLWIECFVDGLGLQLAVPQLEYTEGIALA